MGFEPDMKLTYDWVVLMGSEVDSYTFRYSCFCILTDYSAINEYNTILRLEVVFFCLSHEL